MDIDLVQALEERTFNAWPALSIWQADGWIARFAEGVTGRSNSLNALRPRSTPIEAILDHVEPLYAARGLKSQVRVTPLCPAGIEPTLAARGYRLGEASDVRMAELAEHAVDSQVRLTATSDAAWLEAYHAANPRFDLAGMKVVKRIHDIIVPPVTFGRLEVEGETLALGFAVADRGVVSLNEIATNSKVRGRGLGRRLVSSLLAWGYAQGARRGLLQVSSDNTAAIRLYESLGFQRVYGYQYFIRPE